MRRPRNNIAYTGTPTSNMTSTTASNNSWNLPVTLNDAQFQSVSTSGWDAPRQADGSLPVLPHLRLAPNSTLIDKGTDVGLPHTGPAPDLGAFEQSGGTAPTGQRYEAETVPAVCQGAIDTNNAGYSGSGFCNGNAAVGAYAQFTVNASTAGTAILRIRSPTAPPVAPHDRRSGSSTGPRSPPCRSNPPAPGPHGPPRT
ncbi:hypothetical protein [Actinoplanes xinjiangensis]|uniref:Uncharacterized protein n=1 Tax=Actinoplanes xinjiangensis TaxID=512350 RepID=A0A316EY41_9ACTN|nr:hypothetical protein [Actinoplanes xinjiangensis]PWK36123.1 hypothetical protein BC793_124104 [Actinoplanes xinjiangensis]GIF42870.1 hypothetical protein Axi01nite_71810 [Actinoplanes xinjiangensis]